VRTLIVAAATQLFTERGYTQTTMRDVATSAGIALSVLYRQFESKERLFSSTFVAPFLESFERFRDQRTTTVGNRPADAAVIGEFIHDLHQNLGSHRRTLVTMLGALEDPGTELIDEVRSALGEAWENLHLAGPAPATSGERERDANMLVVAMVAGLVVFQPWVLAARDGDDAPLVALAGVFSAAGMQAAAGDA
jgi:AcrR family transcriptional regulator